jgi:hypothetical protein
MANITLKQEMLIVDFVKTAKMNGAALIFAALPANHPLMASSKGVQMKQIRVVKEELAHYNDEIGNTVALLATGLVRQM